VLGTMSKVYLNHSKNIRSGHDVVGSIVLSEKTIILRILRSMF
jgi:hypothetical protein